MYLKLKRLPIIVLCLLFGHLSSYAFESKIGSSQKILNNYLQKNPYGKPYVFDTKTMEDQLRSIDAGKQQNSKRDDFRFQPPKEESFDYREIREGPGSSGSGNIDAMNLSQHLLILYAFVNNDNYFQSHPEMTQVFNVGFRKVLFVPADDVQLNHGQIVDAKNYPSYYTVEVSPRMQELTRTITPTSVSFLAHEIFATLGINDQAHVLSGYIFRKLSEQKMNSQQIDGTYIQKGNQDGQCREKFKIKTELTLIKLVQISSCNKKFSTFEIYYQCQDNNCLIHHDYKHLLPYDQISIGSRKIIYLLNTQAGQFTQLEQEVTND